jgi:hypothetical protein
LVAAQGAATRHGGAITRSRNAVPGCKAAGIGELVRLNLL